MKKLSILLILFTLFFVGCSNDDPVSDFPNTSNTGDLNLAINKSAVPEDIVLVSARLTREGFNIISGNLNLSNTSTGEITFEEVEEGVWNLTVEAFDNQNILRYYGETNITVIAGQLVPVSLNLEYVGPTTTGSVKIFVTWGSHEGWIDSPSNSIIVPSGSQFDYHSVWQPCVLKEGDTYKMWYNGLTSNGIANIMYASSSDGLNWTSLPEPVLTRSEEGWDSGTTQVGQVIKVGNTYRMYYIGWESQYDGWQIGLAYSADGIIWEKHQEPVLSGPEWGVQISATAIVKKENIFYLYFEARNEVYKSKIGLATSSDGIVWEKHNEPVLTASQDWEGTGIGFPSVILENGQFTLMYNSTDPSGQGFGIAYSQNGVNWTKSVTNPVFTAPQTNNGYQRIAHGDLLKDTDEYKLYYSGTHDTHFTINLATKAL